MVAKYRNLTGRDLRLHGDLLRARARFAETSGNIEFFIKFIFFPFLAMIVAGIIYYIFVIL